MFTSEIDIQHDWNFTTCNVFLEFKKTSQFTLNTAVVVFHLKSVNLLMLSIMLFYAHEVHVYTLFETFSNQPLS